MANMLSTRANRLCLAHCRSLCVVNDHVSLSMLQIPTIYQINVALYSSRELRICNQFSGCMHRRDVDDGLRNMNGIWLTIVHCTISVYITSKSRFRIVSSLRCHLIIVSNISTAYPHFRTSLIMGHIYESQAIVVQ